MPKRSVLAAILLTACAHALGGKPDLVKPTLETFLSRIRWADWRGASEMLVPERRGAFLSARKAENDGKDLQIADYALDDLKLADSNYRAFGAAHLSWLKLPSSSVADKTVEIELIWRDGAWWVASVRDGPFDELATPFEWSPPDAGQ